MPDNNHVARTWLKVTCPFSFKFLLFMTEAGLLDQIEVIACDPEDEEEFERTRVYLSEATGDKPSFPTVETEPGVFKTESEDLIAWYAEQNGMASRDFPVLDYYLAGLFQRVLNLYRENRELKAGQA